MFCGILQGKKKQSYCNNAYYKRQFNKYNDLLSYNILSELSDKESQTTNELIGLFNDLPFDISPRTAKKQFGWPDYTVYQTHISNKIKIFFYRVNINGIMVQMDLHFNQNKLFMYNYTFLCINKYQKNVVKKMLESKYLDSGSLDFSTDFIVDQKGATIMFNDGIYLVLTYTSNCEFLRIIPNYIANEVLKLKRLQKKKKRELYNRL